MKLQDLDIMFQMGLGLMLPKLKYTTEEKGIWNNESLFIDIITQKSRKGGLKFDIIPFPIKDSSLVVCFILCKDFLDCTY